jgi:4-amino-4-deoxy-L-arabinose transferase-like glycosyltransferase
MSAPDHAAHPTPGSTALQALAARSVRRPIDRDLLLSASVTLVGLLFLGISIWWFAVDTRMPNGDNAKHLNLAFGYYDRIRSGAPLAPFTDWTQYPPLVHLVGVLGTAIAGVGVAQAGIAENLVFVPMLVLGCYGAGSVAFDRRVGALAAVFALAAPMTMSLFHVFMLDAPTAALAAMSVWLLLASDRFRRRGVTVAAAVFVALGFYAKGTFVLFVAGLLLVLFVRGGWRQWKNVLLFGVVVLSLVLPWYIEHYSDLTAMTAGATTIARPDRWYGSIPFPDRWTVENFTWYFWNLINNQLYLPLAMFFFVGLVAAVVALARRIRTRPAHTDSSTSTRYLPELLAGGLVAYLGLSYINLDDPRYTFPCLIYVALIGTWWIVELGRRWLTVAAAGLVCIFCVNTLALNFGVVDTVGITTSKTVPSPIGEYSAIVMSPVGYIEGAPLRDGLRPGMLDLLHKARADGAEKVIFQPETLNVGGINLFALGIVARMADLQVPGYSMDLMGPEDVFVFRGSPDQVGKPFCIDAKAGDGTGIYMTKGRPIRGNPLYCPPEP